MRSGHGGTKLSQMARGGLDRPLVAFFGLAYAIAWGLWLVMVWAADSAGMETDSFVRLVEAQDLDGVELAAPSWLLYLLSRVIDFSFTISGLVVVGVTGGRSGLLELGRRLLLWRFGLRWYLLALLPLFLYAGAALLAGADLEVDRGTVGDVLVSLQAGLLVSLFLRGAMGEELGLRGFALPRLQSRISPFRASVVVGVLWGLWHLPVLLGRDLVSVVFFLALAVGLSCLFTLMFNGTGGSLVPGLLFHATQNWDEGIERLFPALVGTEWETPSSLALLVAGAVAGAVLWRRGGAPRSRPRRPWPVDSVRRTGILGPGCSTTARTRALPTSWPTHTILAQHRRQRGRKGSPRTGGAPRGGLGDRVPARRAPADQDERARPARGGRSVRGEDDMAGVVLRCN